MHRGKAGKELREMVGHIWSVNPLVEICVVELRALGRGGRGTISVIHLAISLRLNLLRQMELSMRPFSWSSEYRVSFIMAVHIILNHGFALVCKVAERHQSAMLTRGLDPHVARVRSLLVSEED